MGYYVNPENWMTKEKWLAKYGEEKMLGVDTYDTCPKHQFPVILMDNGPFTAAGICNTPHEWEAMTRPDDFRPKVLYFVDKVRLGPFLTKRY